MPSGSAQPQSRSTAKRRRMTSSEGGKPSEVPMEDTPDRRGKRVAGGDAVTASAKGDLGTVADTSGRLTGPLKVLLRRRPAVASPPDVGDPGDPREAALFEVEGSSTDLTPEQRVELCAPTGMVGHHLVEGGSLVPLYLRRLRVLYGEPGMVDSLGRCTTPQYPMPTVPTRDRQPFRWTTELDQELCAAVQRHGTDWLAILTDRGSRLRHLTPATLRARWGLVGSSAPSAAPTTQ
eukprot:GGOE01049542.1.p2 GENE.GGOE01049542.1~~GGOE01049542.1.p2  ORF type:complete len:235 (+),score=38.85 GGOE01049542.1:33-737(+)